MQVLDYFNQVFPNHDFGGADNKVENILEEVELESSCGDSCRSMIDSAARMLPFIRYAFGDNTHPSGDECRQKIGEAVVEVCCCYIRS